jgi:outer membrane receptor protein involved in Fe transport
VLDVEASYTFNDRYKIVVGAQNVLDEFDREPRVLNLGSEGSLLGLNGGFYYTSISIDL